MNTIQKLEAAEKLATTHNRWSEFSRIYGKYRDGNKVMASVELALRDMKLWDEYTTIVKL